MTRDDGFSLVELLIGLSLGVSLLAIAAPGAQAVLDAGRARHAAAFVVARLRTAKQHAVYRTRAHGLVWQQQGGRWLFEVCVDGNGNGLRRAELSSGIDVCVEGPHDLSVLFPSIVVGIDPSLPAPGGGPGSADPVRFGASDIASFTPAGTASPGSVYLRSAMGAQYAVRVSGVTGRTRVLRFEQSLGRWIEI